MSKPMIKIVVLVIILIGIIAATTTMMIMDIKIGSVNILAIKDITKGKENIEKLNQNLVTANSGYKTKQTTLEKSKTEYSTEKSKYETISDDTIRIIKEATKDEKYFIEYLWITLGKYAKSNELVLTVIEPGGKASSGRPTTGESKTSTATSKVQSSVTAAENSSLVTTIEASNAINPATVTSKTNTETDNSKFVKIELMGSYTGVADFVFEVENDKTLRFKLDNMMMKPDKEANIVASFEIKNLFVKP